MAVEWPIALPTPQIGRQHTIEPRSEVTQFESGRVRSRRLHTRPLELLDVTWAFTQDEYETFEQYFHTDLVNGSLTFEMLTFEEHEHAGLVYEVTQEYAFWQSNYQFARSDNVFHVSASLLLTSEPVRVEVLSPGDWAPPLSGQDDGPWPTSTAAQPTGTTSFSPELGITAGFCNRTFMLAWGNPGPVDSMEIQVETAPGSGMFGTLVTLSATQLRTISSMTLHNQFGGREIRARSNIGTLTSYWSESVIPPYSTVTAPTLSTFSGASQSSYAGPVGLVTSDGSYIISSSPTDWQWVDDRWEYDPDAAVSPPTFSIPVGTELRVTSDGSDPTPDSPTTPQDPTDPSFAGVYKAMAYLPASECYSPPLVIIADRKFDLLVRAMLFARGATVSNNCRDADHHRFPVGSWPTPPGYIEETTSYAGDSCLLLGGGTTGEDIEAKHPVVMLNAAIANSTSGSLYAIGPSHPFTREIASNWLGSAVPDPGTIPYADWGGRYHSVTATWARYSHSTWSSSYVLTDVPVSVTGQISMTYGGNTTTLSAGTVTGPDALASNLEAATDALAVIATDSTLFLLNWYQDNDYSPTITDAHVRLSILID